MKQPVRLLFLFILLLSLRNPALSQEEFRMIGYLPYYRFNLIDSINLEGLTHVCLAFAHPDEHGIIRMEGGGVSTVVKKLKQHNIRILLSLAGGGMSSYRSRLWSFWMSPSQRFRLIQSIISYVRQHDMDGVDVDLEWKDVNRHYSGFIIELSEALKKEGLILSAAWPGIHRYQNLSDEALHAFDFINIMAYDLTGPWDPNRPGQHSSYEFAEDCITFWRNQGVPAQKLNLGLPFYGYNFSDLENVYSVHFKQMVALDPSFAEIDRLGDIYYNGKELIALKTRLAMEQTGGVMFWELGQDAFNEHSLVLASRRALTGERNPGLLAAVNQLPTLPQKEPMLIEVQEKDQTRFYWSIEKGRLLVVQEKSNSGRSRLKLPNGNRPLQVAQVLLMLNPVFSTLKRPEFSIPGS